ncbi:proline iminopeptidase [Marinobacter salarius]|jgi:proline iminopeptidase|uniref:Proline iminopeptidase n=2 Tax=Marinobacter TaxID=2742 RepID=A0ABY1FU55_9GAMM|nr:MULTISPECIES: prolyl aminopeptidase [Marinobacter]KXJ44372.1 MAG: proline iminopeptidase [Marinobacter sp. Hex_13]MAB53806.1 prolyl aminopeptidase [Marinobacter sp.]MBS8232769.1 prolyl aminopeptidase [Marinobacter salarius]SFM10597.1 proline iminopeptidase [Marinobacter salarius]|tara:strand:- start:626 stop:1588 length:963 start_codon:yes stop_codon:yes gene_type:complete
MLTLFPDIKPNAQHRIAVDPPHELFVEESGNPDGIPVLVVHGGPGGGCEDYHRRFFDAERYRIILMDQRGAGRSRPLAEFVGNTTQNLVDDIETVRTFLGVDRWILFGGSWGSTLSLVYAQSHPDRVLGLVLRGIFLCRPRDIHWFYQEGASRVFPDYWRDFLAPIPEGERGDLVAAYYRRLTSSNELEQMQAAKAWSIWEGRCATLHPNPRVVEHFGHPHVAIALARIECHYFMNNAFLEDDQIVRDAALLKDIPGIIVHGRYDMVCPLDNALALSQAWPEADLRIIRDAGHSASEPAIIDALMRGVDEVAAKLEGRDT